MASGRRKKRGPISFTLKTGGNGDFRILADLHHEYGLPAKFVLTT
jgi:hypothetical protein